MLISTIILSIVTILLYIVAFVFAHKLYVLYLSKEMVEGWLVIVPLFLLLFGFIGNNVSYNMWQEKEELKIEKAEAIEDAASDIKYSLSRCEKTEELKSLVKELSEIEK